MGGTPCFKETQTVTVINEAFSVRLGASSQDGVPVSPCFTNNRSLWIAFALNSSPAQEIGGRALARLDVSGDVHISTASIPMGLTNEINGATPLLNLDVNFRHLNKDSSRRGAAFRIDTRDEAPLFQWLRRPAGGSSENATMVLTETGALGVGTTSPKARLDVNGEVQVSTASIPMGLTNEINGATPLFNFDVNFRHSNKDNSRRGAAFRIDTRDGPSLFQWLTRPAGAPTENYSHGAH